MSQPIPFSDADPGETCLASSFSNRRYFGQFTRLFFAAFLSPACPWFST